MEVESVASSSMNGVKLSRKISRIMPWVEKYRPEKVDDVSSQEEVVASLQSSIETGQVPHLLFYGPPGTGKTTTMLALARSLYGPELYRSRILELNASDERGIKVVREKIKTFAQSSVGSQKTPGYPCPKYKFIILDEADTMTPDAQSALRRVIEQYSKVTRFCLICNYVTRLIEPLASRCSKFRFKSLAPTTMISRLNYIANQENVKLADHAMNEIMKAANGDMRKAVTYLQSAHQLSGDTGGIVTPYSIVEMSGRVPPDALDGMWMAIKSGEFVTMETAVDDMICSGYPLAAILSQMHDNVVGSSSSGSSNGNDDDGKNTCVMKGISDNDKAYICEKIAAVEQCLIDGASERLQLLDLAAYCQRRMSGASAQYDVHPQSH
jgi:replication factor C subunit 2/4